MNTTSLIQLLQKTQLLQYVDQDALYTIIQYGQLVDYPQNQKIVEQGKESDGLFILVSGKVAVSVKLLGQGDIVLAHLQPGQFFGEVNLLDNIPCTATVTSEEKTVCFLLSKASYDMFYLGFPKIRYHINQALTESVIVRLQTMKEKIETLAKNSRMNKTSSPTPRMSQRKRMVSLRPKIIQAKLRYIHRLPFFNALEHEQMNLFLQHCQLIDVPDNFTLIEADKLAQSCYFIVNGAVKIGVQSAGKLIKFAVFGPNKIIFPTSMVNNCPEIFCYQTCERARLLEINQAQFLALQDGHESFWYKFHDSLCQTIVSLQKNLNVQMIRMNSEQYQSFVHLR